MNLKSPAYLTAVAVGAACLFGFAGCSKKESPPATAAAPAAPAPAPAAPDTSRPVDAQTTMAATVSSLDAAARDQAAAATTAAASVQAQAAELLARYSGELDTLASQATALKDLVDRNAHLLPAGVQTKYKELNALLPTLNQMVSSLKDYQKVDLNALVPKLQSDFAKAKKLCDEISALVPTTPATPAP